MCFDTIKSEVKTMPEERFDRLENQLSQFMAAAGSRLTGIENRMGSLEQNQNATRDDISGLRNRVDSVDGTVRMAIADGFRQHHRYFDDLNTDLAQVERQTRRINRRVERLERLEGEGA
jgi:chromosome segregation ATPase